MQSESKKIKLNLILGTVFLALFGVLNYMLLTFDVKVVGPEDASIGFSSINTYFRDLIGTNDIFYNITDILGKLAFIVPVVVALVGLVELIKRKSLKKVDRELYCVAGLYVALAIVFITYEKIVINYRPVILEEGLEASFPSSHTMLAILVLTSLAMILRKLIKNKKLRMFTKVLLLALMVVIVVGRFLSGVHWFTDILGGLLISISLLFYFNAALKIVKK